MRIAVDGSLLWGPYSGVENVIDRVVFRLIRDPAPHDWRVYVPADWEGFVESPHLTLPQIERLPFRGNQKARRIAWQQIQLPRLLRGWKADLLFAPGYIAPVLCCCPTLVFVHDLHGLRFDQTRPANYLHYRALLPLTLRRAAGIITPTSMVLDEVRPFLGPHCSAAVAPLGVDRELSPSRGGRAASRPYLLFVGNLEPRKGLDLLVDAFDGVAERFPTLDLVLAGRDYGARARLEVRGVPGRVRFTSYVPRRELVELYLGAFAFVFPSRAEGFGLPPLEAMACGIPVIATDNPTSRETLGQAALLVPADVGSLIQAIILLHDNIDLQQRLSRAGLERARLYHWDRTAAVVRHKIEAMVRGLT